MSSSSSDRDLHTQDGEILADLFDDLLQEILEGRSPDLDEILPDRPDLRDRVAKTWALACSVAGRREGSKPVLGGYEILRELGHGGMGTVYLAQHEILQREVAIKVLPHSLAMSPRAKQRFLEEAKALAQIRHDNVVHIHRVLDHTEMLAFEMEFIDGPSLQQVLQDLRSGTSLAVLGDRSPIEWSVRACIKIARALGETHRHGLVHRDVKPSNILMRSDGTPVLADFGLARLGELRTGQTGDFAGTPVYAAPERLRGGDNDVGPATDIYSLGVTLYEMLSLSPPFSGKSTQEVLRRIEDGDLPDLRKEAPHVSRDLATVVQKAMETDRRHRYATADELADDLERLLNYEPVRARPAGPIRAAVKFLRRNRRVVTAGVVGAMLVAAVTWPIVAHARAAEHAREEADTLLHETRSLLLSPESLHTAWTRAFAGESHQPLQIHSTQKAHIDALQRVAASYDEVLAICPDHEAARFERDAVRRALAMITRRGTQAAEGTLGPDEVPVPATDGAAPAERFAAGLRAFLIGDSATSRACWAQLGAEFDNHPLLDACQALQLAIHGFAEQSFPRLFHATRAFPDASALALAMAAAALEMGDTQLAEEWLGHTGTHDDNRIARTRRRLLEADLLVAQRRHDEGAAIYRELSNRDRTDPMPRQRLAALAVTEGNAAVGRRLLNRILQHWPDQALSRLQLAQLDLQQRRLADYLAHVRYVLGRDLAETSPATTSQLADIVRFGGLDELLERGEPAPSNARRIFALPLANWLPSQVCDGIRGAIRLVATFDRAHAAMRSLDPRPIGATLRATWLTALTLPGATMVLPREWSAALVAGIPALLRHPTDWATEAMMPFQSILGSRALVVTPEVMVPFEIAPPGINYARSSFAAGDIDGDTLADFCLAHPPDPAMPEGGRVELRSSDDGELLRTIRANDGTVLFGRGLTAIDDLDGDGCRDLLIGSPANAKAGGERGTVELYSGRTGERRWLLSHDQPRFGDAIASLPDIDGDGHPDLVVGAPSLHANRGGRAFVCSGVSGETTRELAPPEATPAFGSVATNVGDVDGDGVADFLVTGNAGNTRGYAAVYSGRELSILASFVEDSRLEDFGVGATGLGDVNGDGHADLAISAPGYTGRAQLTGRVVVLDGKTGKLLYELHGEHRGEGFGIAMCALPAWLRDGRPALAISAFRGGPTGHGYVRIFDAGTGQPLQTLAATQGVSLFGPSLFDLGDRDGDGLRDLGVPLILVNNASGVWSASFALTLPR